MNHRGEELGLAPSKLADIGVHTIILDTVAYAALCAEYNGGHFLHHVPKVEMKNDGSVMTAWERLTSGTAPSATSAFTPAQDQAKAMSMSPESRTSDHVRDIVQDQPNREKFLSRASATHTR